MSNAGFYTYQTGKKTAKKRIVFLHGWGQTGQSFDQLAAMFSKNYDIYQLDFPGFGQSPEPATAWSPKEYATALDTWLKSLPKKKTILIGHSFGCRVALHLAATQPEYLYSMILIASPGLQRERKLFEIIHYFIKSRSLKFVSKLCGVIDTTFKTQLREAYRRQFGSADYRAAQGVMRNVLVKTVSENLLSQAAACRTPTLFITGADDNQTPPDIATRLAAAMAENARQDVDVLTGFDHYSILNAGRHQCHRLIEHWIKRS